MLVKINEVIEEVISKTEIKGGLDRGRVLLSWSEIVGKRVASKTRPYLFKKGTLYIAINSATWAQELNLMKTNLINNINSFLGEKTIKDIRFKLRS